MTNVKYGSRIVRAALVSLTVVGLCAGCGGGGDDHDEKTTVANTQQSKVTAPSLESDQNAETTTIAPDRKAAKKLAKQGTKVKDQWYISELESAGIIDGTSHLLKQRKELCSRIKQDNSVRSISGFLGDEGYDEKQQGVVISSALVSECPSLNVTIHKGDLPEISPDAKEGQSHDK